MQLDWSIKYLFPQHLLCTRVEPLPTVCSNMNTVYKVHARENSKYHFSVCAARLAVCVCVCVCKYVTDECKHTHTRMGNANRLLWVFTLLNCWIECTVLHWTHLDYVNHFPFHFQSDPLRFCCGTFHCSQRSKSPQKFKPAQLFSCRLVSLLSANYTKPVSHNASCYSSRPTPLPGFWCCVGCFDSNC